MIGLFLCSLWLSLIELSKVGVVLCHRGALCNVTSKDYWVWLVSFSYGLVIVLNNVLLIFQWEFIAYLPSNFPGVSTSFEGKDKFPLIYETISVEIEEINNSPAENNIILYLLPTSLYYKQ